MKRVEKLERIKTHIKGFDELIQGGFVKNSNVLITGTFGTGKTIFSMEYLYNGIINEKQKGIYFTFEEKKEDLLSQACQFGWDLKQLEKDGMLKIIAIGTDDISKSTIEDMIEIVKKVGAKRVVIDSITTLSYITPESQFSVISEFSIKRFLYSFLARFKDTLGVTTIFISQKDELISNTIAEYLCDGVVNIEYESLGGDYSRNLTIPKMRQTKNDEDLHPMQICEKGVVIHNLE